MTIYPDYTLLIQIINFLILVFILNKILYRPIRYILAKRDQEFNKLISLIDSIKRQVIEKQKSIEEGLIQARRLGSMERESLKEEATEYERKILKETYAVVEEKLVKAKEELERKIEQIQRDLQKEVILFSKELAERILGRRLNK